VDIKLTHFYMVKSD